MDFWISNWISGFHSGFLDFWISAWISGFQFGFLPTVYEISFVTDPSVMASLQRPEHQGVDAMFDHRLSNLETGYDQPP